MNRNFVCINHLIKNGFVTGTNISSNRAPKLLSKKFTYNINNCKFFSVARSTLNMRFVQFTSLKGGPQRLGVQLSQDGDIIDISAVDSSVPNNLVQFLEGGPKLLEKAKRCVCLHIRMYL